MDSTLGNEVASLGVGIVGTIMGDTMPTTKATLVAFRVEFIEAALEWLEREIESAEGNERERMLGWYVGIAAALRNHGLQTVH
jgi:hypothetical protein